MNEFVSDLIYEGQSGKAIAFLIDDLTEAIKQLTEALESRACRCVAMPLPDGQAMLGPGREHCPVHEDEQ